MALENQKAERIGTPPPPMAKPVLAVDMDGALLRTDVLAEGMAQLLFHRPLTFLKALWSLRRGRARFKQAVAAETEIDVATLPVREDFIAFLARERGGGRQLALATAADSATAERVAARIGLFSRIIASGGAVNVKGRRKLAALNESFPEGFAYAGDSSADLQVWRGAQGIVLAGAGPAVKARARALPASIEAEFPERTNAPAAWFRALRPHQWSKNVLILLPLLLGGAFRDSTAILNALLGFALLCVTASATYLVNDLADLPADRRHRTKKRRPFAAGDLPIASGLIVAPLLCAASVAAAFMLNANFALTLSAYLALTLCYSFGWKRVALLDAFILGALYTLRLPMGVELAGVAHSKWLLIFSMFFFFSLSLAKRHGEVLRLASEDSAPGRGYRGQDWPLTLALGVAAGLAAVLILVLYMVNDAFPTGLYHQPLWLWAAPGLVALWTCRIWLLAHRQELDDDPVAFAVRDPISLALGAVLAAAFALALIP